MRADNSLIEKRVYEFGNFRLNMAERVLESAGCPLPVTPKALDVLIVLVANRGRIVEKEDLMRQVWPDTFVEDNNLAFNISVLRKLFGESGASPRYIETISRRGYRFIAEVMEITEKDLPGTDAFREHLVSYPAPLAANLKTPAAEHTDSRVAFSRTLVSVVLALALVGGIVTYYFHR